MIHISPETHARVRAFCKARGLVMREWATRVLLKAVDKRVIEISAPPAAETDAFERPPFWAGRE